MQFPTFLLERIALLCDIRYEQDYLSHDILSLFFRNRIDRKMFLLRLVNASRWPSQDIFHRIFVAKGSWNIFSDLVCWCDSFYSPRPLNQANTKCIRLKRKWEYRGSKEMKVSRLIRFDFSMPKNEKGRKRKCFSFKILLNYSAHTFTSSLLIENSSNKHTVNLRYTVNGVISIRFVSYSHFFVFESEERWFWSFASSASSYYLLFCFRLLTFVIFVSISINR